MGFNSGVNAHPQELQDRAVAMVAGGASLHSVAAQLEISKGTVSRWCDLAGIERSQPKSLENAWQARRLGLIHEIGRVAEKALQRTEEMLDDGDRVAKDFATTMAILIDKAQLLCGDATSRTEALNDRESLKVKAAELDEVAAERQKQAA